MACVLPLMSYRYLHFCTPAYSDSSSEYYCCHSFTKDRIVSVLLFFEEYAISHWVFN